MKLKCLLIKQKVDKLKKLDYIIGVSRLKGKRILLIGAYAGRYSKIGGEIAKVRTIHKYYSAYNEVVLFDTYWEKENFFQFVYKKYLEKVFVYIRLMREIKKSDAIIICRSDAKFERIVNKGKALNKTSVFGIGNRVPEHLLEDCEDIDFWNSLNGIFVESEEMAEQFNLKGVKVAQYVPNFKELPKYGSAKYECDKEIIELFYHGLINECKGIDCLIAAVHKVNKEKVRCKLFLYGECVEGYDLKNELSEYIFFMGRLNLMDSLSDYDLLKQHDVFVFPTKWIAEGLSGSMIDALALGKPILATRHNINDKLITDGENGYMFEKDDTDALEQLILKLYNNQELIYQLGNQSLLRVESFRVENVLGKVGLWE